MRLDFKWRLKLYIDEQFLMEVGMGFPCCRRAVAEGAPMKINMWSDFMSADIKLTL